MNRTITLVFLLAAVLTGRSQEMVRITHDGQTVNIENSKVRKYLDEVSYDYSSPSLMTEYIGTCTKDDESPCGVELDVSGVPEGVKAIFVFAEGTEQKVRRELDKSETVITMTNLLPGTRYSYYVYDAKTYRVLKSARFLTEGRVRMIGLPSLYNCRDMGGWKTLDGRRMKYGMLYRGVELHEGKHNTASEDDKRALLQLGIAAELDMRRTYYIPEYGDFIDNIIPTSSAFGTDVPYLCVNLAGTENMLNAYTSKFRDAIRFIINNLSEGRPVYYHCVWGADRTGTLSALLLALMGVSLNDIYKEYELTSFSTYSSIRDKNSITGRVLDYIGYSETGSRTLQQCAVDFLRNRMNIQESEVEKLRSLLLETDRDIPLAVDGIELSADKLPAATYSAAGVRSTMMQRGLNIVRDADGSVRKVMGGR